MDHVDVAFTEPQLALAPESAQTGPVRLEEKKEKRHLVDDGWQVAMAQDALDVGHVLETVF